MPLLVSTQEIKASRNYMELTVEVSLGIAQLTLVGLVETSETEKFGLPVRTDALVTPEKYRLFFSITCEWTAASQQSITLKLTCLSPVTALFRRNKSLQVTAVQCGRRIANMQNALHWH